MALDYAALQTEIQADTMGLGYSGKSDPEITALLNEIGGSGETIERDVIDTWEIIDATLPSEWAGLSNAEEARYNMLISAGRLNVKSANVRQAFADMFGAATQTRANLLALQTRPASRAEVLFGGGVIVSHLDVARALRGE